MSSRTDPERSRRGSEGHRVLEGNFGGELKVARSHLVGNANQRLAKSRPRSWAIAVGLAVANKIRVVEHVDGFRANVHLQSLRSQRESLFKKRIDLIDRSSPAGIAAHHSSVDHRAICRRAQIAAVVRPG